MHLLYRFELAYSACRNVEVVLGGEIFAAVSSDGCIAASTMSGVSEKHRTESRATACINEIEHKLLTRRYAAPCVHYGIWPNRNNLGVGHENGLIDVRQNA